MSVWRAIGWMLLALVTMAPQFPQATGTTAPTLFPPVGEAGDFSVMTYNIKAQPWPLVSGRAGAVAAIADRLADMRATGRQPRIVLLQEAFTQQAREIAHQAGYRYLTRGPVRVSPGPAAPLGEAYAGAQRWDRGESSAAVFDSGLLILSDYPILRVAQVGFPSGACAGFDCLASKGVLIAWVSVPGQDQPIAVVNTHLNSRKSTHVAPDRADQAQAFQVLSLRKIIDRAIGEGTPTIFGGDTNVGTVPARIAAFRAHPPLGDRSHETLKDMLASLMIDDTSLEEVDAIVARNKDMILTRDGDRTYFEAMGAAVPFPVNGKESLSDHAGFMVSFRLSAS
ncbi:endonuclease/exonuclease/phosphatase family protein [Qipengyuania sp.]|uniref:endonuclease/exonuclease/phosphatase family protein n=1 Tax=Qipengyuania sp. TaxID=2004515 RepID=UPI003AF550C2